MSILTKKRAIVAGVAIVALGSGVAYAYWTTSGSGTGSGSTGTDSGVSIAQLGTISGLTPDSTPQSIDFRITNAAATNQYIGSVTITKDSVSAPNSNATHPCTVDDFAVVQPTAVPGDLTPGSHDYTGSASGATLQLVNTNANQDGCKDATISLGLHANAS